MREGTIAPLIPTKLIPAKTNLRCLILAKD
ncbi:hypothetical protein OVS_02145 [Mycoplasma ovis str. Michigan]|uniref:Uncharacterized protein n=1 Tax=Mycoplasma ovis str. Michigan TaxID=1415773 RepID=A0ABM5P1T8_9MOLU|nr:hypothetical protein OVS_02145 [Mycoplasma ovis str. Michigan]